MEHNPWDTVIEVKCSECGLRKIAAKRYFTEWVLYRDGERVCPACMARHREASYKYKAEQEERWAKKPTYGT